MLFWELICWSLYKSVWLTLKALYMVAIIVSILLGIWNSETEWLRELPVETIKLEYTKVE